MKPIPKVAFFYLLIFMLASQGFRATPAELAPVKVATYDELVHAIREARAAARLRVERAVEQEKVREAWEIGKLIDEHILLHKERADYGEQVIIKLARDLGISETELKYMFQFARTYPIRPAPDELSWSHYRELLSINDSKKREKFARKAERKKWSQKKLRSEIKKFQQKDSTVTSSTDRPLIPLKGSLDTYRVVTATAGEWKGKPVIDLGFSNYYHPSGDFPFQEGDILRVSHGKLEVVKRATELFQPLQLFSYRAYVLDVTDGDTVWVLIDLGFGFSTRQHVRLRGLDAPEISFRDGQAAKRFVERALGNVQQIFITSTKSDKYDRYLADVWVGETYLNQKLIDEGLAVRVSE